MAFLTLTLCTVAFFLLPSLVLSSLSCSVLTAISGYGVVAASPLEQFKAYNLLQVQLGSGTTLSINVVALYAGIAFVLLTAVSSLSLRPLVPQGYKLALMTFHHTVSSLLVSQAGPRGVAFLPLYITLFAFIALVNLMGNVTYSYTITTSLMVTLGISVTLWVWLLISTFQTNGTEFFGTLVPSGTPLVLVPLLVVIELVSYTARAISLGVRLFANMVAGHTLLVILSSFLAPMFASGILIAVVGLLPFGLFVAMIGLEVAVSLIQAYVFTILVANYAQGSLPKFNESTHKCLGSRLTLCFLQYLRVLRKPKYKSTE